jgi:hypothetical protein
VADRKDAKQPRPQPDEELEKDSPTHAPESGEPTERGQPRSESGRSGEPSKHASATTRKPGERERGSG